MLLAIDIGNTNITIGLFRVHGSKENSKLLRSKLDSVNLGYSSPLFSCRLSTSLTATADEIGTKILDLLHYKAIERGKINALAIASVVPVLSQVFMEVASSYFNLKAYFIDEKTKIPIQNLYENPKEVGADRIVNAVSAYLKFGAPCLVVDFGTATTFDCVTKKGEYVGGVIVPGPNLSSESLSLHTAKLPKVAIQKPAKVIGRNTVEAIQSGLYFGYIALVDGVVERLKKELGENTKIIATGGLASLISQDSKTIKKEMIFPDLTLEGIIKLWEKNCG